MKEITAYQLTDGSIYVNKREAKEKQSYIDFCDSVKAFAAKYEPSPKIASSIYAAIKDNAVELNAIFETYKNVYIPQ